MVFKAHYPLCIQGNYGIQAALLASALLLAGCVQDASQQAAPTKVVGAKSLAAQAGFVTEPTQPKDFVVRGRPSGAYEYPYVTPTPTDRATPRKTPVEMQALQDKLDTNRKRSESFAKRPVPKSEYGGIAEARRAAIAARARANKPIYTPNATEGQPTSYPVPEARKTGGKKMSSPLAIPKGE